MTIRLIQVGMGGWGRNWATHVLQPSEDVELVACVDPDAGMLAQAQQLLNLPPERYFPTLEAALSAVEAEAVLITASLPAHVPIALEALCAEKHVLIEKPFAPTLAEARQVVETAAQQRRMLMVSQNYRFFPAVQAVRALVRERNLGEIGAVRIDFRYYKNSDQPADQRYAQVQQPLLMDMAIHHFDLMRVVLGQEPTRITCQSWNPPWSKYVDSASAAATITFDGGTVLSYRGSWVSPGTRTSWSGEWHMECSGGEIVWASRDATAPDYVTLRPLGKRAQHLKLPTLAYTDRSGSLHAFVQAIQAGQEPESSGRDNLPSLALMFAAVESATSHVPVSLHGMKY
ncbi:MAG TPA: Gfo/Idh/MocA family oxidoreductase [Ktedonobacteraceae bacterium]|nr:Gfo/Idh/MocA family oxidoreductase [Ktedonobacteraceae bacterium]